MRDYPAMTDRRGTSEPVPRRIRATLGRRTVLDTTGAIYVWPTVKYPQFHIPIADVDPSAIALGRPGEEGFLRFPWDAFEHWYEEDEEVFVHPRNPYSRVDALRSSRHVRIELYGVMLADSRAPVLVFETGLPTRYYLERTAVDFTVLTHTDTETACPYKGRTSDYWTATVGDMTEIDVAWSYLFPTAALLPIAGLVAFYNDRVDITVDGVRLEPEQDVSRGSAPQ